jgi:uncharacterized protein YcbK (DUF882 family)
VLIDRRLLLRSGAGAVAAALPLPAVGGPSNDWVPPDWHRYGFPSQRWVTALFVHTGERFKNIYCDNGNYVYPAIQLFSWTCRDFRLNQWKWLHPMLLDLLFILHWKYNRNEIQIYSGYRTPETNASIEGAALNSQHIHGKALDVHLPDLDNTEVAKDMKSFIYGGVGMYPLKHFTHLDCGPLRSWTG